MNSWSLPHRLAGIIGNHNGRTQHVTGIIEKGFIRVPDPNNPGSVHVQVFVLKYTVGQAFGNDAAVKTVNKDVFTGLPGRGRTGREHPIVVLST